MTRGNHEMTIGTSGVAVMSGRSPRRRHDLGSHGHVLIIIFTTIPLNLLIIEIGESGIDALVSSGSF